MSTSWHSYPSIFTLGHRYIKDLFTVPVVVEEKVDGSQFSFGLFEEVDQPMTADEAGISHLVWRVRSKGATFPIDAPPKMFARACATVLSLKDKLHVGWTYRGEVLDKPKHNALEYGRVPIGNIILFDINDEHESYLSPEAKVAEAHRLGLEVVPTLYTGMVNSAAELRHLLDRDPLLGGPHKIEGMVIKPLVPLYGQDKKLLLGKFVSEAFKEVHADVWKRGGEFRNDSKQDILDKLANSYATPARWLKAIQHLKEDGKLQDAPQDIPLIMAAIPEDIIKECEDEIKDVLFGWALRELKRGWTRGLPEFYKQQLLDKQFEKDTVSETLGDA